TNGEYRSGPASIAVSVTDATLDSFTALADGAPFTGSVTISGDGPHAVSVQASDRAGHTASAQVSFTIDSTKPVITVTTPADGSYTRDPSPPIAVNVGDDTGIASVTANGSALVYSAGAWRGTLSLADGFNAIDVAAYDLAGNRSDASLSVVLD